MREEASDDALDLLRRAKASALPIDVGKVARYCGLTVERWSHCPSAVCGLLYRGRFREEIHVNDSHALSRRRFTIAHEIGHWLYGDPGEILLTCDSYWLWHVNGNHPATERRVNDFAAQLLMPEPLIRMSLDVGDDLKRLVYRFGVSEEAMKYQLRDLHLLTA